jgi:hypothetical protein
MKNLTTTHFSQFEAWRQNFENNNPTVIYVKAKNERQYSVEPSPESPSDITRTGKQNQTTNFEESYSSTTTSCSQTEQYNTDIIVIPSQASQDVDSIESEDFSETIVAIRNDGAFHPSQFIGRFSSSNQELLLEADDQSDTSSHTPNIRSKTEMQQMMALSRNLNISRLRPIAKLSHTLPLFKIARS